MHKAPLKVDNILLVKLVNILKPWVRFNFNNIKRVGSLLFKDLGTVHQMEMARGEG